MRECCTDHNGNRKQKYPTQEEAENARARRQEEGVSVSVYPCEDGDGWHLTSKDSAPLDRPIREMTIEDRKLYTNKKNLLGNSLNKQLLSRLKDVSEKNTLAIFVKNIEQAQYELDQKKGAFQDCQNELTEVRKRYKQASQDLNEAEHKLRDAQNEYNSAKSRIERKRRR